MTKRQKLASNRTLGTLALSMLLSSLGVSITNAALVIIALAIAACVRTSLPIKIDS